MKVYEAINEAYARKVSKGRDTVPTAEEFAQGAQALMEQCSGMRFSEALYLLEEQAEPAQPPPCELSVEDLSHLAHLLVQSGQATSFADALEIIERGG